MIERRVSHLRHKIPVRGFASNHEHLPIYLYDAPVFSNVNSFNNMLIALSETLPSCRL